MSDSQFKRQMFKIKCSDCGRDAEVPFQPKKIDQYIVKTVSRNIETIRDRYLEER
ncbi:CxxC-x17-CxxC domain-containing protein [[Eubacterium] cellulosolvens]